ncbi:MAG: Nif3-like dinuclear metal center hexameric protein [Deltaproteobacteria bacterium]|nr:Nif3-like dinuclear metal center hexameric protein [Deltaproteobacteria bacterium]
MRLREILDKLEDIAPFDTAQEWDNVGLMLGDPDQEIGSVLVALDPTLETISFARERSIDLIVTHHPLIFNPIKKIDLSFPIGKKIALLIKGDIALVSLHTNLDIAQGGVADLLARSLGLLRITTNGMIRAGYIERSTLLEEWVRSLSALCREDIRIVDAYRDVYKVCVCPGSGMDLWQDAYEAGCDTFVTGDVTYHRALDAFEAGLNIVDLGHFGTEEIIVRPLANILTQRLPDVDIIAMEGKSLLKTI